MHRKSSVTLGICFSYKLFQFFHEVIHSDLDLFTWLSQSPSWKCLRGNSHCLRVFPFQDWELGFPERLWPDGKVKCAPVKLTCSGIFIYSLTYSPNIYDRGSILCSMVEWGIKQSCFKKLRVWWERKYWYRTFTKISLVFVDFIKMSQMETTGLCCWNSPAPFRTSAM